jgi:hypothetical protein
MSRKNPTKSVYRRNKAPPQRRGLPKGDKTQGETFMTLKERLVEENNLVPKVMKTIITDVEKAIKTYDWEKFDAYDFVTPHVDLNKNTLVYKRSELENDRNVVWITEHGWKSILSHDKNNDLSYSFYDEIKSMLNHLLIANVIADIAHVNGELYIALFVE